MIVLVGYMGAGKTTLGKALAKRMDCEFCDLDKYIEQSTQQTIPQIFELQGEESFRKIEAEALQHVLGRQQGVVAVGGGTPCHENNMELINQKATAIYLKASPETLRCHIRMGGNNRPLVNNKSDDELLDYIKQSMQIREPYYEQAKYTLEIDTITTEEQISHYVEQLARIAQNSKPALTIIKVGGKIVESDATLSQLIADFSKLHGHKMLVHGGGRSATQLATQLGIETQMVDGRRITDEQMLHVVTMVYAGLVNKNIVAKLQAHGINALGLTGADMNMIHSHRREATPIDFGFVGDVDVVDANRLSMLIDSGITPVMAPLTHDGNGTLLNTNADTIAGEVAKALVGHYNVTLVYCFEKAGVLYDENDDTSVIPHITPTDFQHLTDEHIVQGGMIPKLQNALSAIDAGVKEVIITKADAIASNRGTRITSE